MNLDDREEYEAWFRAEYGQEPMPRTSPAHDFCYAGWKAATARASKIILEAGFRSNGTPAYEVMAEKIRGKK